MITEPGFYDISAAEYHADPCHPMSLSSTGARTLIRDCPAQFMWDRDNPPEKREFDIGNAAHLLVLQPDRYEAAIFRVDAGDYRTKDARAQRDGARENGRIPLTRAEAEMVDAMRNAIFTHPVAGKAFANGHTEQSIFWRDSEFGIWCRTRPDFLPAHRRYLVDLKTATSADPEDFTRAVLTYGYHQQAAWYMDGVEAVTGTRPERFAFVVVSKKPPYFVTVCWLDDEMIGWGQVLNRRAKGLFAWCLHYRTWPAYRPEITGPPAAFTISMPDWARRRLEEQDEAGAFEPPLIEKEERV
jgi:hypothetical protein